MKLRYAIVGSLLLAAGCATYKQLKPKPEPAPLEQGYIEIKNDKKNFELKKEKRYFITFPGPRRGPFLFGMDIPQKNKIKSFFSPR